MHIPNRLAQGSRGRCVEQDGSRRRHVKAIKLNPVEVEHVAVVNKIGQRQDDARSGAAPVEMDAVVNRPDATGIRPGDGGYEWIGVSGVIPEERAAGRPAFVDEVFLLPGLELIDAIALESPGGVCYPD